MSWEIWRKEHPYIAHPREKKDEDSPVRSADKLAEMIKATVGNHEGTRTTHVPGSGGSIVKKTTKADLKRPVQPKGHKDSGDSARTTIRMAAHYRGKRGEQVGPQGEIKPEAGNTGKLRSADKLVAARDSRPAESDRSAERAARLAGEGRFAYPKAKNEAAAASQVASLHGNRPEDHREAARLHREAAKIAPDRDARNAHLAKADSHDAKAEGGVEAPKPSEERARQHYQMVADRATKASDSARTSKDHEEAAAMQRRAADLAPSEKHYNVHTKLAENHDAQARLQRRSEESAAEESARKMEENRRQLEQQAAERKAAQERLAARSADMHAARLERESGPRDGLVAMKNIAAKNKAGSMTDEDAERAKEGVKKAYADQRKKAISAEAKADLSGSKEDREAAIKEHLTAATMAHTSAQRAMHTQRMHNLQTAPTPKTPAKTAKPAALTGQNIHKTMEGEGFQRAQQQRATRTHDGQLLQRPSGKTGGKYDISKNYDGSYRVDVHGSYSAYTDNHEKDAARHQASVDKATKALEAKGWTVKPGHTGMRGHLEVSKAEEPRSADKVVQARDARAGAEVRKDARGAYSVHGSTSKGNTYAVHSAQNRDIRSQTAANKLAGYHEDIAKVVDSSGEKGHVPLNIHQNGDVFHDATNKKLGHIQTPGEKRAAEEAKAAAPGGHSTEAEIEKIQRDHPNVSLSVTRGSGGHLVIHKIVVPKEGRGQGTGGAIMKRITDAADRNGDKLALTPSKDFGASSVARLTSFYKGHGFKPKDKSDFSTRETMVREPKSPKA